MKEIRNFIVDNKIKKNYPPLHVEVADSFLKRLMGLMGRKYLAVGNGLLLIPCNSIHMMFMRFAIDVIYLDKDYKIIKLVKRLKPWLGISICRKAYCAIEVTGGMIDSYKYAVGDKLIVDKFIKK